jgi:hypothetical protein
VTGYPQSQPEFYQSYIPPLAAGTLKMVNVVRANMLQHLQHDVIKHQTTKLHTVMIDHAKSYGSSLQMF